jgi:predicted patatin/cPLA2 family phospholipase
MCHARFVAEIVRLATSLRAGSRLPPIASPPVRLAGVAFVDAATATRVAGAV